jgi:hypothetical protein
MESYILQAGMKREVNLSRLHRYEDISPGAFDFNHTSYIEKRGSTE